LGEIEISSDSSDSQYSEESSRLDGRVIHEKQNTPDASFLSSRRDNQSIDDVGDESVVDWLESGSIQTNTLISEDDSTANSPIFSFHTMSTEHPKLTTPRKLQYHNVESLEGYHSRIQHEHHSVKSTERVERRHVLNLPTAKPAVTSGDWLSHRYVVNAYIILNEIGRGAFAEVRLCKNKTNNKLYAVKIMSRMKFDPTEVDIMKKLRHPNVLQLYEVMDDHRGESPYMIKMCN
jgi:hypothetical protein